MKTLRVNLLLAFLGILFFSCKKNISEEISVDANSVKKIDSYFTEKINELSSSPIRLERVKNLEQKILYSSLKEYKTIDNETIYILQLSENTYTLKDNKKQILIFYLEGEKIKSGYIISASEENLKKESLIDLLSNKDNDFTGTIDLNTVYDKFINRTNYEKGAEKSNTAMNKKASGNGNLLPSYCTDWYWVTTYYNADGTSYTSTEYAFTTCDCSPLNESFCDDPNGGSGGNEQGFELMISREQSWHAYYGDVYGTWTTVWALDKLKGKRNASEPQGGHFTSNNHLGTSWSQTTVTWETTYSNATYSNQTATTQIIGRATKGSNPILNSDKTKTYSFSAVFP